MSEASLAYKMNSRPLWTTWQDLFLNTTPPQPDKSKQKVLYDFLSCLFKNPHSIPWFINIQTMMVLKN